MHSAQNRLENYPKLEDWFLKHATAPPAGGDLAEQLIWSACKALSQDDSGMLNTWCSALETFLDKTKLAHQDFLKVEDFLAAGGLDFFSFATEVSELAIILKEERNYFQLMQSVANKTELVVFRFMAAWTALNCGDLASCIAECEKVHQPFACVHTIHGQALLESGQPRDAIEVLKIAIALSPTELLAHFQLAKAYQVTEDFDAAWEALVHCDHLAPGHPEIAYFFGLVALTQPKTNLDYLKAAWTSLLPFLDSKTVDINFMLIDLALQLDSKERFHALLNAAPWQQLKEDPVFLQKISWILKVLGEKNWTDHSVQFLDQIVKTA